MLRTVSRIGFKPNRVSINRISINNLSTTVSKNDQNDDMGQKNRVGERTLFRSKDGMTIPIMFGVTCLNWVIWPMSILDHYVINPNSEIPGLISEYPVLGFFGLFGCGVMTYFINVFSASYCHRVYESSDEKRIGFQVHNILGVPSRKFEVPKHSAKIIGSDGKEANLPQDFRTVKNGNFLGGNYVMIRVEGIGYNILVNKGGSFHDDFEKFLLH